ncbi:MAG: hypothetical protein JW969_08560 [Spirochaetales bacterium]|nr:hypothetical protein [Spirochaetales bacterium]
MRKTAFLALILGLVITTLTFIAGCQDIFTTQFFKSLQPGLDTLTNDQLIDYAFSALPSSTDSEKVSLYTTLKARLAVPPNDTDAELNYVTAIYATDLADVVEIEPLIVGYLSEFNTIATTVPIPTPDALGFIEIRTDEIFDPTITPVSEVDHFLEAAQYFGDAEANGKVLSKAEYYISKIDDQIAWFAANDAPAPVTLGELSYRAYVSAPLNPAFPSYAAILTDIGSYSTGLPYPLSGIVLFDLPLCMGAIIDLSGLPPP